MDVGGDLPAARDVGTSRDNFVLTSDVYFLSRGDVAAKQDVVTQSFPEVLMRGGHRADRWQGDGTDGAHAPRAATAHWITDVEYGAGNLLARVIVNRLWQHHIHSRINLLPYDQFVRWQIACDLLKPDESLARTATGFLVAGVENIVQSEKEFERDRYDKLDDMVSTLGTALMTKSR